MHFSRDKARAITPLAAKPAELLPGTMIAILGRRRMVGITTKARRHEERAEYPTPNTQHPTPNDGDAACGILIGCRMLDVLSTGPAPFVPPCLRGDIPFSPPDWITTLRTLIPLRRRLGGAAIEIHPSASADPFQAATGHPPGVVALGVDDLQVVRCVPGIRRIADR